jgi:hypothetical protein
MLALAPRATGAADSPPAVLDTMIANRRGDEEREPYSPHQGLALPGLSPNEFAARFWLL